MDFMRIARIPSAAVIAVVASVAGFGLGQVTVQTQDRVLAREVIYTQALAAIEQAYVEPLDQRCTNGAPPCGTEALIYESIDGMLKTLDPHSGFFSPLDFRRLRERQEGHYSGIGITISKVGPDVVVAALFEGSPAYKAGIRRGDIIAKVNSEEAKPAWTTQDVVDRVKGERGTTVNIGIRRPGVDELINLVVARDQIKIPSLRTAFMVGTGASTGTGYVRLQDFSETTTEELSEALVKLKRAGMTQLILDLRDNPGGPLDQAIAVSSQFLKKGELVVYTRGRTANSDEDYHVPDRMSGYTTLPLIVLVDRQSASASEIVTGAMQDHDRGVVIGETTFGKALVQSVYNIANGTGLALTTGRYYTPSGRMIQRPWDGTFDDYLTYGLRDQDTNRTHAATDLKYTDHKRKVYGGGGVEPDHFIAGPIEGFNPRPWTRALYSRGMFVGFAERFTKEGDARAGARASSQAHRVTADWVLTDAMVQEFHKYLEDSRVRMDEAAFTADLAFIKAMIRFEVDVDLFSVEQARRNLTTVDPQVQAALGYFDEAKQLLATR